MGDELLLELCAIHRVHSPRNLTVEVHHIIPVSWQQHYQPPVAPFPGMDPDGRGQLWDSRTITLCPTSHRNTHFWIVRLMHNQAAAQSDDPKVGYQTEAPTDRRHAEFPIAFQALARFTQTGGSLLQLAADGEWGEA